jgi:hypothetical protein
VRRLRHPIRAIREPFGTAGLIVACVALVLAMGGAAVAAKSGLTGKQKKEVEKIAKKFAGKPGAAGAQGPAGPAGPKGDTGSAGGAGVAGVSPAGTNFTGSKTVGSVTCTEGGTEYKGATTNLVCNGKRGTNGTTGFTDTLPSGKTETGAWGSGFPEDGTGASKRFYAISFPIPLAESTTGTTPDKDDPVKATFVGPTEASAPGCPGRGGAKDPEETPETFPAAGEYTPTIPRAEPGNLCVYATSFQESVFNPVIGFRRSVYETGTWYWETGVSSTGTTLTIICGSGEQSCIATGTWAVTAE